MLEFHMLPPMPRRHKPHPYARCSTGTYFITMKKLRESWGILQSIILLLYPFKRPSLRPLLQMVFQILCPSKQ